MSDEPPGGSGGPGAPCQSVMHESITTRVLLLERGELLFSRDVDLGVDDIQCDEAGQLWKRGHAAADLCV